MYSELFYEIPGDYMYVLQREDALVFVDPEDVLGELPHTGRHLGIGLSSLSQSVCSQPCRL